MVFIGKINKRIKITEIPIIGLLSNFGYVMLLIITNETIMLNINAIYGLNNLLRYNVAIMNEIPGIGNPINPFVSILSAITLYRVNLKIPHMMINRLTSITIAWKMPGVVLIQQ